MKKHIVFLGLIVVLLTLIGAVTGQEKENFLFGEEKLQVIVYVIGEVENPGRYSIPDKTDLAELLAIAGGPTRFTNLSSVTITRHETPFFVAASENGSAYSSKKQIIKFNVKDYLKKQDGPPAPKVKPGDIISVSSNKWHTWRSVAIVLRDLSVVASAYFLYLRATK